MNASPGVRADSEVERTLVIAAHPDDTEFAVAGTVASWVASGTAVTYCVSHRRSGRRVRPDLERHELPEIRRREQRAAAQEVGVRDVRFLGYVDGELVVYRDLVRDLVRVIRQVRPQRVVIQSPERATR